MSDGYRVLSLFDGMGCAHLAMQGAGLQVERYVAFEVDRFCNEAVAHNFPDAERRGDVFDADFTEFEGFDFLMGGSPCTYWSVAQSADRRETTASGVGWELFQQYVRALREARPRWFIYENNKSMSRAIRDSISAEFGFEPVWINSALVSAQKRDRLYWVGRREEDGTYSQVPVGQPADRGLLLRDVLETGTDLTGRDKSYALTATYDGAVPWNTIERNQRSMVAEPVATAPMRVGGLPTKDGSGVSTSQSARIYSTEGKSVTLQSGQNTGGGRGALTGLYAVPASAASVPVYEVRGGEIEIQGRRYPIRLPDGKYIIRKLSVRECMRLQTVPEWYDFSCVSNTQAYKMLGNGWTVEVIVHLLRSIMEGEEDAGSGD